VSKTNEINETLRTIHTMYSTHGNFTEQEIGDEDLEAVLDATVRAANASARQSYSIVVVRDREMQKKLCGYAGSATLVFCIDYTRIAVTAEHLGHPFAAQGMTSFVTGSTDTILAAQTAVIAAHSLGIDSLLTNGVHRGDMNRIYDLLDLPHEDCFPLIAIVLGYADAKPAYLKGRLRGPGVVHYGAYRHPTSAELDEIVAQYDDPETHLGLNDAWRDEFDHYLDWFYTVWSVRPGSGTGISQVQQMVDRAGFVEE
jgi:nitroreductase